MTRAERRKAISANTMRMLAEERNRKQISMNQLAALTGLNQSTISRLESDPENPTLDSLLRIADALNVDLGTVLTEAAAAVAADK